MNFPKKTALATLLLLSTANAFAAQDATLTVTGKISPGACTINFTTNDGKIEYTIDPTTLSATGQTDLDPKEMGYTIGCKAPMKVATTWEDNRSDSSPNGTSFGLGKHGSAGANIGYYQVRSKGMATGDGKSLRPIAQDNDMRGSDWIILDDNVPLLNPGTRYMSFMENGSSTIDPIALQNYSGTFSVKTTINPTNDLDLGTQVKLDGNSTITLNYP